MGVAWRRPRERKERTCLEESVCVRLGRECRCVWVGSGGMGGGGGGFWGGVLTPLWPKCLGKLDRVSTKLCPGEVAQQEAEWTRHSNRTVESNQQKQKNLSKLLCYGSNTPTYLLRPRFDRSKYSTASGDPTQRERSTWRKQNQPFVQMSSKTVSYGVQWRYTLYINLLGCSVSCFSHRKLPRFVLSY